MIRRTWVATLVAALLAACSRMSDDEAVRLVREYNARVIEGFRAGDVRLVENITGEEEGRKLTGLIGVKLDQGLNMDAELLDFRVTAVERGGGRTTVRTEERWRYRDRRIGTGEQVGEESVDEYAMQYVLARLEGKWLVERIQFAAPPKVGRRAPPIMGDVKSMHGLQTVAPDNRR